jgi:hypothetical protein
LWQQPVEGTHTVTGPDYKLTPTGGGFNEVDWVFSLTASRWTKHRNERVSAHRPHGFGDGMLPNGGNATDMLESSSA